MKKLLLITTILLAGCTSTSTKQEASSRTKSVYICNSLGAKTYHRTEDCRGLASCKAEIIKVDLEDVRGNRRACKICYK